VLTTRERELVSLPSLVPAGYASFDLSLAFPFVFHVMVPTIGFYWILSPNLVEAKKFLSKSRTIDI